MRFRLPFLSVLVAALAISFSSQSQPDVVLYTVPGSSLTFTLAVDDFQTKRDEAWRRKIMDTFRDCFGDVDALETEWRSYMRKLKTDLEILQERI
jgi:hypothetical protein